MLLVEILIGVLIVGAILAVWWHNRVTADNERLRNLIGVAYQKVGEIDRIIDKVQPAVDKGAVADDTLSLAVKEVFDEYGERVRDVLDVLSDPDSIKAQKWLDKPGSGS